MTRGGLAFCAALSLSVALSGCSSSLNTLTVTPTPQITLPNGGLALTLAGIGTTSTIKVTEVNYNGTFNASSSASTIASVLASQPSAEDSFTVTAVGVGKTNITVTDSGGRSATVPVTVIGFGAVTIAPASLSFTAAGAANAQTVTVSEKNYSGTFTASTAPSAHSGSCSGIATISPASGASFTVVPVAAGQCTFTFNGSAGATATLPVTVTTTTVGGS